MHALCQDEVQVPVADEAYDSVLHQKLASVAAWLLQSSAFKTIVNAAIITQSFLLVIDQGRRLEGSPELVVVVVLEYTFFAMYVTELSCHFILDGFSAMRDGWVLFDTVLVAVAGLSLLLVPFLRFIFTSLASSNLAPVLVLRTARLARLVRAVRLVRAFRQLWMLVHAFLSSVNTMLYVIMMLAVVMFIFSAVAIEIIPLRYKESSTVPDEVMDIVHENFGNMTKTMLTLLQFVCMDSIAAVYRPLIDYDWSLIFFFPLVVLVIGIVLMNIVTAVIVNSALQQSSEDRELKKVEEQAQREKLMTSLKQMFDRLDLDGSGMIDLEELSSIQGSDAELLQEFSNFADPLDIFSALDIDGQGSLDIEEFTEGLYHVYVSETPIEMKRIAKQMEKMVEQEMQLKRVAVIEAQVGMILQGLSVVTDIVQNIAACQTSPCPSIGKVGERDNKLDNIEALVSAAPMRLDAPVVSPPSCPVIVDVTSAKWFPVETGITQRKSSAGRVGNTSSYEARSRLQSLKVNAVDFETEPRLDSGVLGVTPPRPPPASFGKGPRHMRMRSTSANRNLENAKSHDEGAFTALRSLTRRLSAADAD